MYMWTSSHILQKLLQLCNKRKSIRTANECIIFVPCVIESPVKSFRLPMSALIFVPCVTESVKSLVCFSVHNHKSKYVCIIPFVSHSVTNRFKWLKMTISESLNEACGEYFSGHPVVCIFLGSQRVAPTLMETFSH